MAVNDPVITIGVLALQGAFEEHQRSVEAISPRIATVQIRTPDQLSAVDGLILPGGESTAMGLIGDATPGLWEALRAHVRAGDRPTWGTCAGMILLAERCVGTSAVIDAGQSLIGGLDVLVCRNYFGSQVSSFEMATPAPPRPPRHVAGTEEGAAAAAAPFPGVFIRAPAILTAGPGVEVLGTVVASPCRAAAPVLRALERKIAAGEDVVRLGVVDALARGAGGGVAYAEPEKATTVRDRGAVVLPGASAGTDAREVICAVRKGAILCTAFHPEIGDDLRWHKYFVGMVLATKQNP